MATERHLDFTVVIPLAFHGGLGLRCIECWTGEQTFPRERFEIVIAVPPSYPKSDLARIRAVLSSQDRIEYYPFEHDVPLAAAAAELACGEAIFITETHCLPEAEALSRAFSTLAQHPEWAGFSCDSIPITDNLLSEISAEMYGGDIRRNLQEHPWLKVLDQCLIVRREAYEKSGGIEAEYGHFAEWLLAARFFRLNMEIGYDPVPAIRHYYIGRLRYLKLVTLDFAESEIRFMAHRRDDPRIGYFPEIPELVSRRQWSRIDAWHMTGILWRSFFLLLLQRLSRTPPLQGTVPPYQGLKSNLLIWTWRTVSGMRGALLTARLRALSHNLGVRWYLLLGIHAEAKSAFLKWITSLMHVARIGFLRKSDVPSKPEPIAPDAIQPSGDWLVGAGSALDFIGFHPLESHDGKSLRWSSSIAAVFIPLKAGTHRVTLEWNKVRYLSEKEQLIFHLNGSFIPGHQLRLQAYRVEIHIMVESFGMQRLGWNIVPFPAKGDPRDLGLPIQKVTWETVDPSAIPSPDPPWVAR